MIVINKVVLSVLACLENEDVRNQILKTHELKIVKLEHYEEYINSAEFKTKVINDVNFENCVSYAISKVSDEKFRTYAEKSNICYIAFYKKEKTEQNLIANGSKSSNKNSNVFTSLSRLITKYYIEDTTLYVCVNPVKLFKERILSHEEELLKHFNDNGETVDKLIVKFIHNGIVLDDLGETFLELGYGIK